MKFWERYVFLKKCKIFLYKNIKYINVRNKISKEEAYKNECYKKLYKKFYKYLRNIKIDNYNNIEKSNKIFVCWLQGFDNAPELVKKCLDSIKKNASSMEIILLDESNFRNYTNIPEYIIKKWEKGIISNAHFSDIIRTEVLISEGGLWLDATVYLTDSINNFFINDKLFVFKQISLNQSDELPIIASNWLIYSCKNNNILRGTRELIYQYWKKYNYALNYNIFHLFFTMSTKFFKNEWNEVRTFNNISPHILQFELFDKYNEERFNEIKTMSKFHKLNWKLKRKNENEYTFYDYIIQK